MTTSVRMHAKPSREVQIRRERLASTLCRRRPRDARLQPWRRIPSSDPPSRAMCQAVRRTLCQEFPLLTLRRRVSSRARVRLGVAPGRRRRLRARALRRHNTSIRRQIRHITPQHRQRWRCETSRACLRRRARRQLNTRPRGRINTAERRRRRLAACTTLQRIRRHQRALQPRARLR